ncbi:MAG: ACP S-malonyltransferase [Candidatus Lambdaproteobacteria bacterium]|nr:ACP S-malonyltransferase [Candidatus Lambdaproteobacteria bacterium]
MFPGQGSQQVGMGKEFAANHPLARELFAQASDALGYDLKRLCLHGPEDELTLTYNAQPAILTVSVIAYRLLAERAPVAPLSLAGHSLGEYSAIVAAGALAFADAVRTVHRRGSFMQEATPPGVGAMAAILGMEGAALEALCREEAQGQVVSPANFNAPGQIVISGNAEAVQRVLARAKGRLLQVSAPFHCALLQPAAERMREVLAELRFADAAAPVVANADNAFLAQAAAFPPSLVRQVTAPVRWDSGVKAMIGGGVDRLIEVGHGTVLGGLMKRIDRAVPALSVQDEASLKATLAALGA